ncbi:Crp/Fnr family transcriptional regulator [Terrimonas pollutisoli]|uniref:Crp/Fnr family transcriptional regulator n=1 Tax=Terrimonas pollutisoli TaxID=3034147 RepID=UPI0023EE1F40|nr:Crp/Fnr family transcriptional regulator [Terrimonas sp. H1YJ31]
MSDEMKYFYLKNHPLLASLPEQKLQVAASLAKMKTVYRGEIIGYGETGFSKIHFLVKGKVKITDNGAMENELVKDILTEPDIFGDLGLEGLLTSDECAEALTANTVICTFHVSDFRRILEDNPQMILNYARKVTSKLQRLETRHADLVFLDTKDRLIRFIKNWARTDGNRKGDKIILNNYLTHSDIAGFIATSRQSVNMLLNELRSSGLLCYNRKSIELNNPVAWN